MTKPAWSATLARGRNRYQLGRFWLYQRPDTGTWSICWLDKPVGSTKAVLRRRATAFAGGRADKPPQGAIEALEAHCRSNATVGLEKPPVGTLEALMNDWLCHHVSTLAAPERYSYSARLWFQFFDKETRAGRLAPEPTMNEVCPALVRSFIAWRQSQGVGGHTISRDIAALRGTLYWAWKMHRIDRVPYICDVPSELKAPPRERVLSFEELGRMLEACAERGEREHLIRFIIVELGTAGRPQAILEMTDANIDLVRGLIDPNQPGRRHLRKRRAIVPIAHHVRPWLEDVQGKLIKYRAPIAERHRCPGGATHFEQETASIKTAWNAVCREAEVVGATPKTLRHTMLTWLAMRGVPKEQRNALAGHSPSDTTARNYEHLTPEYLRDVVSAIDDFFGELSKNTLVHLKRPPGATNVMRKHHSVGETARSHRVWA